jgi:Trk K+ transport system NAD-binding subunit
MFEAVQRGGASDPVPATGRRDGRRRILLLGGGDLNDETFRALDASGAAVVRLRRPVERQVTRAIEEGVDAVAIVTRDDVVALRLALLVAAHLNETPLLVTIFDATMATELRRAVPQARVTSMAEIVAPSLAGPCVDPGFIALIDTDDGPVGLRKGPEGLERAPLPERKKRRVAAVARSVLTPFDPSARILLFGLVGLLSVLVVETTLATLVLDESFVDALYASTKTLATVGPNPAVDDAPAWFKMFVSGAILTELGFAAIFTAGLVNRLLDRRLTGIVGRRAVPRRDHVVVVGLGQVGLSLCLQLRDCEVPVVGVEREGEPENVNRGQELGLPVVVGSEANPTLLGRLSLHHAQALAAVTSDDLMNVRVAMASRAVNEKLGVVLRAGDGELASETESLFRIGIVRDVHRIAAVYLAAAALGSRAEGVVVLDGRPHLLHPDGRTEAVPTPAGSRAKAARAER